MLQHMLEPCYERVPCLDALCRSYNWFSNSKTNELCLLALFMDNCKNNLEKKQCLGRTQKSKAAPGIHI